MTGSTDAPGDKLNAVADARHREDPHLILRQRQDTACQQNALLLQMPERTTKATELVMTLTQPVLTEGVYQYIIETKAE